MSDSRQKNLMSNYLMHEHKFALLLVALIGVIGSTYVLSSINNTVVDPNHSVIRLDQELGERSPQLKISGEKTEGNLLKFSISNYNTELEHIIYFGDGTKHHLQASTFSHQYEEAGEYEILIGVDYLMQQNYANKYFVSIAPASKP